MYQSSCVFTSSIGYLGGPGSGTAMLAVGLFVLSEWRAPNGSVMALKLQHDCFHSAGAGSMRPRLYPGPLRLCSQYNVRQKRPRVGEICPGGALSGGIMSGGGICPGIMSVFRSVVHVCVKC